jgi:ribosomal protein S12 methylthiotransferase
MLAQQRVNEQTLEALVGTAVEVLVEGEHEETDLLLTGRTRFQAPEVDGTVIINDIEGADVGSVQPGTIGSVEITEVAGYDLVGTFRATAREGSAD